jgi:hypothetical protein
MVYLRVLFQTETPNLLFIAGEHYGKIWGRVYILSHHITLRQMDRLS